MGKEKELQEWINKPVLERIKEVHGLLPVYAVNLSDARLMIHQITEFSLAGEVKIENSATCLSLVGYGTGEINLPDETTFILTPEHKEAKTIIAEYLSDPTPVIDIKVLKEKVVLLFFNSEPLANYND